MSLFLQLLANGIASAALYAMLAVGFGMIWRTLRIFHIAYGGLFVVSGYLFWTLVVKAGMSTIIAGLITVAASAVIGWLMEFVLYRPFYRRRASSGTVLIASLGILVVIENVIALVFGNDLQTIPRQMTSAVTLGSVRLVPLQLWGGIVGLFSVSVLWILVRKLKVFKALWAMGDQPELIPVLGLPLFRLRGLVLAIGTAMAAIPAVIITLDVGIAPHVGMSYLLIASVAVLVGGINSYRGWVIGAVLLAVIQSVVIWKFSARWMDLVTFGLLVVMLLFRPRGLMKTVIRTEEA